MTILQNPNKIELDTNEFVDYIGDIFIRINRRENKRWHSNC